MGENGKTYDRLDPVGHTKDVGMPVIVGSAIVGHFICREASYETGSLCDRVVNGPRAEAKAEISTSGTDCRKVEGEFALRSEVKGFPVKQQHNVCQQGPKLLP